MPVQPIDLQPLLMQQHQVGAQQGVAHEQPVAQQRQLVEEVKKEGIENDHKVQQALADEELATHEREGKGGGAPGHQGKRPAAAAAEEPTAPPPAADPFRGHHIDVKQ